MPGMSGDKFIAAAQKLPHGKARYFIITGGVAADWDSDFRRDLGVEAPGLIYKPFSEKDIYAILMGVNKPENPS